MDIILPVILSGGKGMRLWPLSRKSFPKQYLNLENEGNYTLLQNTFLRLSKIKNILNPLIICDEEHRFIVAEQMRKINVEPFSILLEPLGRNTAPAITLAAFRAIKEEMDPLLLILSADHKIENNPKFISSIKKGLSFAKQGRIVTFGVKTTSPETGFGYIETFDQISNNCEVSKIKRFIEKPTKDKAIQFFEDSHFLWNSGMFLFKASTILNEIKKYQFQIYERCKKSIDKSNKDFYFERIDKYNFQKCPNISIDLAIMEKTTLGTVVSLDAGWDDLGSWKSIWENAKVDKENNSIIGRTLTRDVKNSYLKSDGRLIVALGIKDLILVETIDAILVSNKNSINNLKKILQESEKVFDEINLNKTVYRPWGKFTLLTGNKNWQIKKIEVYPQESISLQLHRLRSEHWIVVEGIAKIEIENEEFTLKENESTFVPRGSKHRLSNPYKKKLVLLEIQNGSYLGEDDIIRFEDKYRR